jgi:hypothetical protein
MIANYLPFIIYQEHPFGCKKAFFLLEKNKKEIAYGYC